MAPLAMQLLRDKSRSTIIYFLFSILIIVFAFTFNTSGPGGCGSPGPLETELAEVDGQIINQGMLVMGSELTPGSWRPDRSSAGDLEGKMVRFYYLNPVAPLQVLMAGRMPLDTPAFKDQPAARFASFTRAMTPADDIKEVRIMNDLVENLLVAREAKEMGLVADPKEIEQRILTEQWFDAETKKFKEGAFKRFLQQLGISPEYFREFVGNELLREHVIATIAGIVTVSDGEATRLATDMNTLVRFQSITLDPDALQPLVTVTAAEIAAAGQDEAGLKAYFDAHRSEFQREQKVKVRALLVSAPAQAAVDAVDGDAKAALLKQRAAAEAKAKGFQAEIAGATGADVFKAQDDTFEALAKANSADDQKAAGGLYDEMMNATLLEATFSPAVAKAAIALKKGQISSTISDDRGFWVLFAVDNQAARTQALEQVKGPIQAKLAKQKKAPEFAKATAEALLKAAQAEPTKNLEEIAQAWNERNRPADTAAGGPTQPKPPEEAKPVEAKPAEAKPVEAKPAEAKPADAQPAEAKPVEAKPADAQPADAQPVEAKPAGAQPTEAKPVEAKPIVAPSNDRVPGVEAAEDEQSDAPFEGMLRATDSPPVARLSGGAYPGAPFEYMADGGKTGQAAETPFDAEDDGWTNVPGVGKNEALMRTLFTLTTEKPVVSKVFASEDGKRYFVIRHLETITPKAEDMPRLTVKVKRQLLAVRQREAYRAWYKSVLTKATADGDVGFSEAWTKIVETATTNYNTYAQKAAR